VKISIIFHSLHGHGYRMAREIRQGALEAPDTSVEIYRVRELLSEESLKEIGAWEACREFADLPVADLDALREADGIILGAPTYFGMPSSQMMAFLNEASPLWEKGDLVGKPGSAFTTASEQNGGQETCLHALHTFFFHQGMLALSLPSDLGTAEMHVDTIPVGGYVYGASMITGGMNDREITPEEIRIARLQGRFVAGITRDLVTGRRMNRK